jgi:hypothetical protein
VPACAVEGEEQVSSNGYATGLGAGYSSTQTLPPGLEPIGTEGLLGKCDARFITVAGPCGGYHIMSHKAAGQLREWLGAKLGATLPAHDLERLVKLMSLTTSDFDGEALSALRKANEALAAAKLTWSDVLR